MILQVAKRIANIRFDFGDNRVSHSRIKYVLIKGKQIRPDKLSMFFSWCDSIQDEIQIIQWSENDLAQIVREIKLKEIASSKLVLICHKNKIKTT
ncbi:MAG: hypothetical protein ACLU3N_01290 [Lachnospiraceae bacterium]